MKCHLVSQSVEQFLALPQICYCVYFLLWKSECIIYGVHNYPRKFYPLAGLQYWFLEIYQYGQILYKKYQCISLAVMDSFWELAISRISSKWRISSILNQLELRKHSGCWSHLHEQRQGDWYNFCFPWSFTSWWRGTEKKSFVWEQSISPPRWDVSPEWDIGRMVYFTL